MSFQYFSDVHTEFFHNIEQVEQIDIKAMAPYLIIAGDIGNVFNKYREYYVRLLAKVSSMFKYVFIISGNHEYYSLTSQNTETSDEWFKLVESEIMNIAKQFPNVIYLQNEIFNIPDTDICIYGTTLWSNINPFYQSKILRQMSDYTLIPNFSIGKTREIYNSNVEKLQDVILQSTNKRFVVISHHLPSYELIDDKYKYCDLNSAFASSVNISMDNKIVAWVAGHTHMPQEKGKFHVNPIGYPGENMYANYNKTFIV